jgi:hypothetical protein
MGDGNASLLDLKKMRQAAAQQAAKASPASPKPAPLQKSLGNQEMSDLLGKQAVADPDAKKPATKEKDSGVETSFTETSGFDLKAGKPPNNKSGFEAEVEVPISDRKLGDFKFVTPLKLKAEGSRESEQPTSLGASELQSLKTEAGLTIVNLEVEKKLAPFAKLKLDGELGGSGSVTRGFGSGGKNQEALGSEASLKGGLYLSPETSFGKLKLDTTLGVTGSAEKTFGEEPESTLKAKGTLGVKAGFESKPLRRLEGPLLKDVKLTSSADASYSLGVDRDKGLSQKLHGGGEVGLEGKLSRKTTIFIKLKGGFDFDPATKTVDYSVQFPLGIKF